MRIPGAVLMDAHFSSFELIYLHLDFNIGDVFGGREIITSKSGRVSHVLTFHFRKIIKKGIVTSTIVDGRPCLVYINFISKA